MYKKDKERTKVNCLKKHMTLDDRVVVNHNGIFEGYVTMISKKGIDVRINNKTIFVKWCNVIALSYTLFS